MKFCSKSCFSHEGMVRMLKWIPLKPTASKRKHEDMRETQGKTRGFLNYLAHSIQKLTTSSVIHQISSGPWGLQINLCVDRIPGWWQLKHFFLEFSPPNFGEDESILTVAYFSDGWEKTTNQQSYLGVIKCGTIPEGGTILKPCEVSRAVEAR